MHKVTFKENDMNDKKGILKIDYTDNKTST